jgi:DNA-binding transcriptional LysR family regulator
MLDLNDFRYFVRIAECGGITAASRNLNVPKSTVSHRLQQLETSLGVRLVNRTSRSLSMTDAGDLFYRHAVAMLERADLAESAVRERLMEPSGTIRFTTAVATSLFALRSSVAPPMLNETFAGPPSSSTPRRATGTSWATTLRCSSSAIP